MPTCYLRRGSFRVDASSLASIRRQVGNSMRCRGAISNGGRKLKEPSLFASIWMYPGLEPCFQKLNNFSTKKNLSQSTDVFVRAGVLHSYLFYAVSTNPSPPHLQRRSLESSFPISNALEIAFPVFYADILIENLTFVTCQHYNRKCKPAAQCQQFVRGVSCPTCFWKSNEIPDVELEIKPYLIKRNPVTI